MPKFDKHSPSPADFSVENHGSICLVRAHTAAAKEHLSEVSYAQDEIQFWGGAMVVEPRYVDGVVTALRDNGFNL